jgi:hypothetical protein
VDEGIRTVTADRVAAKWVAIARHCQGILPLSKAQMGLMGALCRETDPTTVVRTRDGYHVLSSPYGATITRRANGTGYLTVELA